MKHSLSLRVLSFLILPTWLATGCVMAGSWSDTTGEEQISSSTYLYQNLNLSYSADADQLSVLAQFRNTDAFHESVELTNGYSVMLDAQPLSFNYVPPSTASGGSYYSRTMSRPWDLARSYEFSWQSAGGELYRNRVRLPSRFGVSTSVQTIHRGETYLMVTYIGSDLAPGETVSLDITGDYGTSVRATTFSPFSRTVAIDLSRLVDVSRRYDSTTLKIVPTKRATGHLSDSTFAGGDWTSTYQAETLMVYVQP